MYAPGGAGAGAAGVDGWTRDGGRRFVLVGYTGISACDTDS